VAIVRHLAESQAAGVSPDDHFDSVIPALAEKCHRAAVLWKVWAEGDCTSWMVEAHAVRAEDAHASPCRLPADLPLELGAGFLAGLAQASGEQVQEPHVAGRALGDEAEHPGRRDARDDKVNVAGDGLQAWIRLVAGHLISARIDRVHRAFEAELLQR